MNKSTINKKPSWFTDSKLKNIVFAGWESFCKKHGLDKAILRIEDIRLEHPADLSHGDYSSNLAMIVFGRVKDTIKAKTPPELAGLIADEIKKTDMVDKIEVAKPGFINFWLSKDYLLIKAKFINEEKSFSEIMATVLRGKKYLLEHTSPDPIKTIHIGHFRNNFIGMTSRNLLTFLGAKVTLDCINNDRGTHICRAIWGYLVFGRKSVPSDYKINNYKEKAKKYIVSDKEVEKVAKKIDWKDLLRKWTKNPNDWFCPEDFCLRSDHFNNIFYSLGQRGQDRVKEVKSQVGEILKTWESSDQNLRRLWRQIICWSLEGYEKTYRRIGSYHDKIWNESEIYSKGKIWVEKGLKKKVFRRLEDGGVLSNLKSYGLSDTILMKSNGSTLYHTQDLALTDLKIKTFPSDLYIWDIGNEQRLYLKQLYAMCEQLGIANSEELFHLNYGFITLKSGEKMSSRYGGVINGDDLLDLLKKEVLAVVDQSNKELRGKVGSKEKDKIAEVAALSACKYGFLKYSREKDFAFDIKESLSVEGDSGPYLQYAYTRCLSVLRKANKKEVFSLNNKKPMFSPEELALLRFFYQFEEMIFESAKSFAPHLVCQYLFSLSQKFNLFYQKCRIIDPKGKEKDKQELRLFLTTTTSVILKRGLAILGIDVLDRM